MPDDSLERLRKRLYKKGETFEGRFEEPELTYREEKVKTGWEERPPEKKSIAQYLTPKPRHSNMKILAIIATVFVFILVVLAGVYLFGGLGTVSGRNIELTISAPESVGGGEQVRWEVMIRNRNDVKLETADIRFYYPAGSRPVRELPRGALIEHRSLEEILPGEVVRETFSAFVYGAEGYEGEARVVLEYRTEGSNAIFEKEERASITLSRSPIGVSIALPKEVNVGRKVTIEVRYSSNAKGVLKDLVLEVLYPAGFTFKDASLKPQQGNNQWALGDLAPGEERSVRISGIFEGEERAERAVQARVGVLEDNKLNVYGEASRTVTLRRLFIDLALKINGQDTPTLRGGDTLNIEVLWRNNLSQALTNVTLEVGLSGEAIDERSISVSQGFYRGLDKKVIWTSSSLPDLRFLNPGGEGRARFSMKVLDAAAFSASGIRNLKIEFSGSMTPAGPILGLEGVDVSGKVDVSLKLETSLQLSSRGLYYGGVPRGSGPLPPRVGQETVYTVAWSISNTSNNIRDSVVRAAVPSYVNWKGVVSPGGEAVIFDSARSEVVWRVGKLKAGIGINQPAREVMFQIGFIPSVGQVGSSPVLLFDIEAEGRDEFTGNQVRSSASPLTIDISAFDSGVRAGEEKVAP
ncbi:hypothetical protein IIA95_02755 [Patescibacteria group bacterium]|nr:hypothetical protein [Patescibacteria group bacterium]